MIRAEVERFLRDTGMAPSRFGRNAINDSRLVWQLRDGRELRKRQRQRVRDYIRGYGK